MVSLGGTPNPIPPFTPTNVQTPATISVPAVRVYVKPHVGGLDADGIPWTGGEPANMFWSDSKRSRALSKFGMRGKQDFRQYTARIKGIEPKFKKVPGLDGLGLSDFEAEVLRHLEIHGMDSIFYQMSPLKELHNIVQHHSLFTIQSVLDSVKDMKKLYDDYDEENLIDAGLFLLASIDVDMKSMINPYLGTDETGPEAGFASTYTSGCTKGKYTNSTVPLLVYY